MAAWTYILLCADGSYYVGCTTALEQRIGQHQDGLFSGYTSSRLPVQLVWCSEHQHINDAIDEERRLKGWSRAKKVALINGQHEDLPRLSSRAHRHPPPSSS